MTTEQILQSAFQRLNQATASATKSTQNLGKAVKQAMQQEEISKQSSTKRRWNEKYNRR